MDTRLDASRLESLLESARLMGSTLELDQQINHLLRTVMGRLLATRALVALDQPGGYRVAAVPGLTGLKSGDPITQEAALALGLNHRFNIEGQDGPSGFLAVNDPLHQSLDHDEDEFVCALAGLAAAIDPDEVARLLMLTLAGRWALLRHGLVTWKAGTPPIRRL